jgi:type VI secretion system protein ImpB
MGESIQQKLSRVRKPRVHITYEVETEGASVVRELPFVVGVMGDYLGNAPQGPVKSLKERKFINIDRDSFDDVMSRLGPGLQLKVENTLAGDGTNIPVQLKFNSLEDFEPGRVLDQVEPLRKLLDTRNRLRELMNVVDRSEDLEVELEKLLINADDIKKLAAEMGLPKTDGAAKAGDPAKAGDGAKAGDPAAPAAEPKTPNTPEGEPK